MSLRPQNFSFEFFPPRTPAGHANYLAAAGTLATLKPSFLSMTYGAGGTTKDLSPDLATALLRDTGVPVAAHITYTGTPRTELFEITDKLWDNGIHHLVALRGDRPVDAPAVQGHGYFHDTSHFVAALRARHDFEISVGTYPEKHPDSPDLQADVDFLKRKADAGATRAITQFFFDNGAYYRFLDRCAASGVKDIDIVPGILPIQDYAGMQKFATRCAVNIPDTLSARFAAAASGDVPKHAAEVLSAQSDDLVSHGVSHIHYYTLNKSDLLANALQLRA